MEDNNSLIKVSSGLMQAFGQGAININLMPKDILVLECLVAGTSFRNLQKIEPELLNKVKLEMVREGKNEHDEFAVALQFNSKKVGYIPRDKNEVIARLMDAGKSFFATIEAKEWEGNWLKIEIKVYLKD